MFLMIESHMTTAALFELPLGGCGTVVPWLRSTPSAVLAVSDALDVREVLVGSENQREGRNDLREREKQGERGTFGQAPCIILYRLA
ncbi:UNVERIFIED_CONTAM: hypothetical protein FKN15_037785 [Acipenser sinensis]